LFRIFLFSIDKLHLLSFITKVILPSFKFYSYFKGFTSKQVNKFLYFESKKETELNSISFLNLLSV
ncbi:hypothetical protein CBF93_01880, partial [Limosilactobacillus reuteri]